MLGLIVTVMITPVSDFVLDGLQRSHEGQPIGSFTARSLLDNVGETHNRYDVAYRWPNEYRIKTYRPDTSDAIRELAIESSRIVQFDPTIQQYTVDDRDSKELVGGALARLEQGLDDLLFAFVDHKGMGIWLDELRQVPHWKTTADSQRVRLNYEGDSRNIELDIDKKSFLITRIDVKIGLQRLEWKIAYDSKAKSTRFTPPRGSFQVPIFDRQLKQPTYANSQAREATEKVFAAYSGLTSIGYKVERESVATTVHMHRNFIKQDDPVAEWTYDGKILTYHQKQTGDWYRGRATFSQVIDAVGNLGTRVDPTVMLLMRGFNPYRQRLGDGAHVRVMGSIEIEDGVKVTMLGAESDNANITLYVRDSDGRVLSTITRAKGATMNALNIELKFNYFDVPSNVADQQKLAAPVGTTFKLVGPILTPSG